MRDFKVPLRPSLVRFGIRAALALVCVAASGCASRSGSPFAKLPPAEARALARQLAAERERSLSADLASAFEGRAPRNVLVLSGGGADGAFGCGFLDGWRDAPTGRRPVFDVVTGVSTGALMATATFLGEERDDRALAAIYTTIHDKDVFGGLFAPGPPNSLFDTQPLQRLIAAHITRDVLRRVAEAHRAGRRLYVATVGLDQGRLVVWPLSKIAADAGDEISEAALERYRRILLAASAVPLLFPPVEIDGDLHVDAGLRENLFLRPEMLGPGAAPDSADPQAPADVTTVYAIVNGNVGGEPRTVGNDLVHIGVRSLDLYNGALIAMSLRNVARVAVCHEPRCRFKYVLIPQEAEPRPRPGLFTEAFDPKVMQGLYTQGQSLAKGLVSPWQEGLPRPDGDAEPEAQTVAEGR